VRRLKFTTPEDFIPKITNSAPLSSLSQQHIYLAKSQRFYSTTSFETEEEPTQEQSTERTDPVRTIYTFPRITYASNLSKLKIFQTVAVTGLVPYVYAGYIMGSVSYVFMLSSLTIMITSTISLYLIGDIISKMVCIMKYNDDTGDVNISHINFWGRRRDVTIPVSTFVPISDSKENLTDAYIKLDTYDKSESFLIFLNTCTEEQKTEVLKLVG
jgi:hypothetical protein